MGCLGGSADFDNDMPQTLTLTIDENDEYTNIMADLETYVIEMTAKFIMGTESMDNYDNFIATMEKMGARDAVELQQAALDRYHTR